MPGCRCGRPRRASARRCYRSRCLRGWHCASSSLRTAAGTCLWCPGRTVSDSSRGEHWSARDPAAAGPAARRGPREARPRRRVPKAQGRRCRSRWVFHAPGRMDAFFPAGVSVIAVGVPVRADGHSRLTCYPIEDGCDVAAVTISVSGSITVGERSFNQFLTQVAGHIVFLSSRHCAVSSA